MVTKQQLLDLQMEIAEKKEREREMKKEIEHEKMLDAWEANLHSYIAANQRQKMKERREMEMRVEKLYDAENGFCYQEPPAAIIKSRNNARWGDVIGAIAAVAVLALFVAAFI